MIEYTDNKIIANGIEYDFKGLNTSHIIWHLQELNKPERFLNNLYETYNMPEHISYLSLAEGTDFDAIMIDDKLFRINKLSESCRNNVQDYINKYAYATALTKILQESNVIGCGLNHVYDLKESYTFTSKAYDKLFENMQFTKEMGRLVESIGDKTKIDIYEGNNSYLRGYSRSRVIENWKCPFKFNNITRYMFEGVKQDGNNSIVKFTDKDGVQMEAVFENTNSKLIESGINLKHLLKENNLVEAYRVGTLLEYQQPFTLKAASLLSYEKSGDLLKLTLKDAFGNKGDIYATLNIPVDDFIKKYKKTMESVINEPYAGENIRSTSEFLTDASEDIASLSRIKNKSVDTDESTLSYKVAPFKPVPAGKNDEYVARKRDDRNKFVIAAEDEDGVPYSLVYKYKGNDINSDIDEMNNLADDFDFEDPSEIYSFYSIISDYGNIERSAKRGISTKDRNYKRNVKEEGVVMEAEGVQVSDIAPKQDQSVGIIKVKMKRRKPKKVENDIANFNKSDLLINSLDEQDEFYGSRGFIKDEQGHYHFGDYYINESGKVVHKSRLSEEFWNVDGEKEYKGVKISVEKSDKGKKSYIPLRNEKFKPENGVQFFSLDAVKKYIDKKLNEGYFSEKDIELHEDQKSADEAYYKVNDVALKLQEVKPFIKDGTEADKLYNNIVIELNSLQMSLYNEGLNESQNKEVDYKISDKQNDPEDFVTKDIPDDKLPVDLAKQGKCPYCAGPMSDEEYKVFGMCGNCYDNGVE